MHKFVNIKQISDTVIEVVMEGPQGPSHGPANNLYLNVDASGNVVSRLGSYTGAITIARTTGDVAGKWAITPTEVSAHVFSTANSIVEATVMNVDAVRHIGSTFVGGDVIVALHNNVAALADEPFAIHLVW